MTDKSHGHFYVGLLPDGRFVAASAGAPYFCFRGESEDAVLERVKQALTYYSDFIGKPSEIIITSRTQTVTRVQPTRKYNLRDFAPEHCVAA